MKKFLMTPAAVFCCTMTMAVFTACVNDSVDNPVIPEPVNPETPAQQAFWAPFDAWQTDSCTAGDDFYMHMVGTWWKNPVDIYPNGLMSYATELNYEREVAILNSNPNLVKLSDEAYNTEMLDEDGVMQIVNAKVEELWAGAVTREEALAALGRAWAEGYTLFVEPLVNLINGVPTWQLEKKLPSYITDMQLYYSKQEKWRFLAPRKSARMESRAAQDAMSDLDIIIKAMDIGVDHVEVAEDTEELLQWLTAGQWSTVEGIRKEIETAVALLDGTLVSDEFLEAYNEYLPIFLESLDFKDKKIALTRENIVNYVRVYMPNLYMLDDYNRQYITPAVRQRYTEWCQRFSQAMRQRLEANTWLESATRQSALDKLDNIVYFVGGIDVIPDCVIPTLTGKDLIDDVRQLRKARLDGYRWAAGQPRSKMAMLLENLRYYSDAAIDNASYAPWLNVVCINPSNLCEPYVEEDYEDALQWAYLATTIGHELTHAFDDDGAQYDLWGNQENWWTAADATKFQTLCVKLVDQYDHLQLMPWADPTLYGDGENTLGENIADLGGCCLGLQILLEEHPNATDAEKMALARRYFQGWAIQWSAAYDLEYATKMKEGDVHSQARERTNGIVRNVDEWYDAYDIKSGTLYLQPSERVQIW